MSSARPAPRLPGAPEAPPAQPVYRLKHRDNTVYARTLKMPTASGVLGLSKDEVSSDFRAFASKLGVPASVSAGVSSSVPRQVLAAVSADPRWPTGAPSLPPLAPLLKDVRDTVIRSLETAAFGSPEAASTMAAAVVGSGYSEQGIPGIGGPMQPLTGPPPPSQYLAALSGCSLLEPARAMSGWVAARVVSEAGSRAVLTSGGPGWLSGYTGPETVRAGVTADYGYAAGGSAGSDSGGREGSSAVAAAMGLPLGVAPVRLELSLRERLAALSARREEEEKRFLALREHYIAQLQRYHLERKESERALEVLQDETQRARAVVRPNRPSAFASDAEEWAAAQRLALSMQAVVRQNQQLRARLAAVTGRASGNVPGAEYELGSDAASQAGFDADTVMYTEEGRVVAPGRSAAGRKLEPGEHDDDAVATEADRSDRAAVAASMAAAAAAKRRREAGPPAPVGGGAVAPPPQRRAAAPSKALQPDASAGEGEGAEDTPRAKGKKGARAASSSSDGEEGGAGNSANGDADVDDTPASAEWRESFLETDPYRRRVRAAPRALPAAAKPLLLAAGDLVATPYGRGVVLSQTDDAGSADRVRVRLSWASLAVLHVSSVVLLATAGEEYLAPPATDALLLAEAAGKAGTPGAAAAARRANAVGGPSLLDGRHAPASVLGDRARREAAAAPAADAIIAKARAAGRMVDDGEEEEEEDGNDSEGGGAAARSTSTSYPSSYAAGVSRSERARILIAGLERTAEAAGYALVPPGDDEDAPEAEAEESYEDALKMLPRRLKLKGGYTWSTAFKRPVYRLTRATTEAQVPRGVALQVDPTKATTLTGYVAGMRDRLGDAEAGAAGSDAAATAQRYYHQAVAAQGEIERLRRRLTLLEETCAVQREALNENRVASTRTLEQLVEARAALSQVEQERDAYEGEIEQLTERHTKLVERLRVWETQLLSGEGSSGTGGGALPPRPSFFSWGALRALDKRVAAANSSSSGAAGGAGAPGAAAGPSLLLATLGLDNEQGEAPVSRFNSGASDGSVQIVEVRGPNGGFAPFGSRKGVASPTTSGGMTGAGFKAGTPRKRHEVNTSALADNDNDSTSSSSSEEEEEQRVVRGRGSLTSSGRSLLSSPPNASASDARAMQRRIEETEAEEASAAAPSGGKGSAAARDDEDDGSGTSGSDDEDGSGAISALSAFRNTAEDDLRGSSRTRSSVAGSSAASRAGSGASAAGSSSSSAALAGTKRPRPQEESDEDDGSTTELEGEEEDEEESDEEDVTPLEALLRSGNIGGGYDAIPVRRVVVAPRTVTLVFRDATGRKASETSVNRTKVYPLQRAEKLGLAPFGFYKHAMSKGAVPRP